MRITKNQLKEKIRSVIEASNDAKKAKEMGLKSKGFGNWVDPKTGQHYSSKGGKLHKVDSKDKGDVGGPAHPNVPKKKPSKPKIAKGMDNPYADDEKKKHISKGDKDKLGKVSKMMGKEKPSDEPDDKATQYKKVKKGRRDALSTINSGELNADNMQDTFEKIKAYADWMGYEEIEEFEEELEDMIEDQDTEWFIDRAEELLDPDKKEKDMGKTLAQMDYDDEDSPESYYDDNTPTPKQINNLNKMAEKGNNQLIDTERYGMVAWTNGDPDEDTFFATDEDGEEIELDYDEIIRFHNPDDLGKNESIKESKGKKCTVKEVKQWMRTLEENRYKKTYNSDARRVSWFVNNNLSEDYETMPMSMQKKWSKAAYKRERFLAKEFIKHLESKKVNEVKLTKRMLIKTILETIIKG